MRGHPRHGLDGAGPGLRRRRCTTTPRGPRVPAAGARVRGGPSRPTGKSCHCRKPITFGCQRRIGDTCQYERSLLSVLVHCDRVVPVAGGICSRDPGATASIDVCSAGDRNVSRFSNLDRSGLFRTLSTRPSRARCPTDDSVQLAYGQQMCRYNSPISMRHKHR